MGQKLNIKKTPLDKLFSQYIRLKADFTCKACDKQDVPFMVDCAHIIGRRHTATRWLEDNAVCLCKACHFFYTEHPHDWYEITLEWLGERLQEIRLLANTGKPPKINERIAIGEDLIEKIKSLGEKPVCGLGRKLKK